MICCPSGYTCGTYSYAWVCTSSYIGNPQTTLDLYTAGSKSGSYTAVFGGVNAFSVQIRFQATDFVSKTTSNPSATATVAATDFVSTTTSNPSATATVTDVQSPGLSTGAKAGIGVGVAIGVLALLLLGALLFRRKPKIDQTPVTEQTQYGTDTKQELDGIPYVTPKVKDVSPPVAELDASELHSDFTSSQQGMTIRDLIDAVPETRSAASAPHEARIREVEGEHDIQQQIKRIREEKERLTRINELERLEAELQERLAGPTST